MIHPSVFALSHVPDNICHNILFPDTVCTLSVLENDSYHDSPQLIWVVTSFSSWVLLSNQVSPPYVITLSRHSLNAFLFSLIGTSLSRMILSSLQNALHSCPILLFISCTWSLSSSHNITEMDVFVFLHDLLFIDNHIILVDTLATYYFIVLPRCILRPTGLLMSWISWSISCSFEMEFDIRFISLTKKRWGISIHRRS